LGHPPPWPRGLTPQLGSEHTRRFIALFSSQRAPAASAQNGSVRIQPSTKDTPTADNRQEQAVLIHHFFPFAVSIALPTSGTYITTGLQARGRIE